MKYLFPLIIIIFVTLEAFSSDSTATFSKQNTFYPYKKGTTQFGFVFRNYFALGSLIAPERIFYLNVRVRPGIFVYNNLYTGISFSGIRFSTYLHSIGGEYKNNFWSVGPVIRYYLKRFYLDGELLTGNIIEKSGPWQSKPGKLYNYTSLGGGINLKLSKKLYFEYDFKRYIGLNNGIKNFTSGHIGVNYLFMK